MTVASSAAPRGNRDIRLLAGVLVALIVIVVLTLIAGPGETASPLSVHSSEPEGAMALRLWLDKSGYTVHEITADPIQMGPEGALFILDPETTYSSDEALYVQNWVRAGHVLIAAGNPDTLNDLLKPYQVALNYTFSDSPNSPDAPTLITPPSDTAQARYTITTTRTDIITHASNDNNKAIISFDEGLGQVWVLGTSYPFTNLGLQDSANARLLANLIKDLPHTTVGFDEARHGFGTPHSVSAWLFNTPPGWSILLFIGLTLSHLTLRGRRFGRVVPIPEDRLLREPVEYIQAMANLFRRSGQRTEMLKHYRAQFRRRLSERYNVDPRASDVELVKTIVFRDPNVDETALRTLLSALSQQSIGEAQLVETASRVDDWLRAMV